MSKYKKICTGFCGADLVAIDSSLNVHGDIFKVKIKNDELRIKRTMFQSNTEIQDGDDLLLCFLNEAGDAMCKIVKNLVKVDYALNVGLNTKSVDYEQIFEFDEVKILSVIPTPIVLNEKAYQKVKSSKRVLSNVYDKYMSRVITAHSTACLVNDLSEYVNDLGKLNLFIKEGDNTYESLIVPIKE